MTIDLTSDLTATLVRWVGDDRSVAQAARVSTGKDEDEYSESADRGLLNYLMKHRHGSPFEHNSMTFRVEAPIFVFREWHRHRVGWSYNEVSGRYTKLAPLFYTYPEGRPLAQAGSSAHPELVAGDAALAIEIALTDFDAAEYAWGKYEQRLAAGAAKEVARSVLPLSIYSSMYATCNARSLMAFLSLRVDDEDAMFESKPQWEIEQLALQMEAEFARIFPITHKAFIDNGRVCP